MLKILVDESFSLKEKLAWNCKGIDNFDSGLFLGQLGIGYCQKMIQTGIKPFVIITVREPIDLLRSAFQYTLEHPELYPEAIYLNEKSLSEWIVEWDANPELPASKNFREVIRLSSAHLCGIYECSGLTEEEARDLALKNLQTCDVVAVTEKLDDILDQFRYLLPNFTKIFDCKYVLPRLNASKRPKHILSHQAKMILKRWAKNEIIIYNEAVKRHDYLTRKARVCMALEQR